MEFNFSLFVNLSAMLARVVGSVNISYRSRICGSVILKTYVSGGGQIII
jgi:hypothetical protein